MTAIFRSHDVVYIERMCPRVYVIDNGWLMYSGDTEVPKRKCRERNSEPHRALQGPTREPCLPDLRTERRGDRHVMFFD